MDNPEPPSPAPDPAAPASPVPPRPAPARPRLRRLAAAAGRLTFGAVRAVWYLVLAAVFVGAYLWVFGLPGPVVRNLLSRLDTDPFLLAAGRLRLLSGGRVAAEDVRVFGREPEREVLATAARVVFQPDWSRLRKGQMVLSGVEVVDADVNVRLAAAAGRQAPVLGLSNLSLCVVWTAEAIEVRDVRGAFSGLPVAGEGRMARHTGPGKGTRFWPRLDRALAGRADWPSWVADLARELEAARFDADSQARVRFAAGIPTGATVFACSASGSAIRAHGLDWARWSFSGSWSNGALTLEQTVEERAGEALHARVELGAGGEASAEVDSTLAPARVAGLLPERWRAYAAAHAISGAGPARLQAHLGPAPVSNLLTHIRGHVELAGFTWTNMTLRDLGFGFARTGALWSVTDARATEAVENGRLGLAGSWDQSTSSLAVDILAHGDPELIQPLFPRGVYRVLHWFSFPSDPIRFEARLCGLTRNLDTLGLAGRIGASNCTLHGASIGSMDAAIAYTNKVLTFREGRVVRPEGTATGRFTVDLAQSFLDFDVDSTLDPNAVAQAIGTNFQQLIADGRFEGPTHIRARGRADVGKGNRHDLRVELDGDRLGVRWLVADHASVVVQVTGHTVVFSNIDAQVFGGRLAGRFSLQPSLDEPAIRYRFLLGVTNIDLEAAGPTLPGVHRGQYKGRLTGELNLTGLFDARWRQSAEGGGWVRLTGEQLHRLRLFGGISGILGAVSPGLGYAAQDAFTATFRVGDGCVTTSDAMLLGALISVRGRGRYYLDHRLDFDVELQLLRSGGVASILRFLTKPVTRLLAYDLEGTLGEPIWRPRSLPREIFSRPKEKPEP